MLPTSILDEIQKILNSFWWGSGKDGKGGIKWLAWDKLSVKKESGGMYCHDLHSFNIAMLGKIGWKLYFAYDTLVYKIFKAKYLETVPRCSSDKVTTPVKRYRCYPASCLFCENGLANA